MEPCTWVEPVVLGMLGVAIVASVAVMVLRGMGDELMTMDTAWRILELEFPWPQNYARITRTSSGQWRCDIEVNGGDGPVYSGMGTTASLAIYQAAAEADAAKRRETE